ncbi:uncharacterized protein O3C94_010303 [Discoglossus pictus]
MRCMLLAGVVLLCLALRSTVHAASFPQNALKTACRSRVFWIWVDKNFFGQNLWYLEAFNETGYPVEIDNGRASQCGYALSQDLYGNVEIRISFLGCWVNNIADLQFKVMVQFQVSANGGAPIPYPVLMACSLDNPWTLREIICEENYMEVSVRRIVPWIAQDGLTEDLQLGWPVTQEVVSQNPTWQLEFHLKNQTVFSISAAVAFQQGYGLNATATRVVFRAPYNASESQIIMVSAYHLEVIFSKMLYNQPLVMLIVDTSTACPNDPPIFTATSLSWLTPSVIVPLVLDLSSQKDVGITMGVSGRLLKSDVIAQNGYTFQKNSTSVDITIPYGAPGGYMESDVVDNEYGTTYSIHLLLQREWRGKTADITRHTAYKPVVTPFMPQSPVFLNYTKPELGYFNISLGNFFPDVDLKSFIIHNMPLTLDAAKARGFQVIKVPNRNGTSAFFLQVPFSDPLVVQEYLPGFRRQYTLYVTYILTLLTKNKDFTYTDVVKCIAADVPPEYNGFCTSDTLGFDMTHGNVDIFWIPYIRNLRLTEALIKSQNYTVYHRDSNFHFEVPLFAVGLMYEDVSLGGISARLDFSLRDNKTLEVRSNFSVVCNFPTDRMLICLPNGTMKVVVISSDTKPSFNPQRTHLRDPACTPVEADDTRALFSFSVSACGTIRQISGDFMVYENEIQFDREVLPKVQPVISRDPTYRLTLRCRYPIKDIQRVWGQYNNSALIQRGLSGPIPRNQPKVQRKRARHTQAAELRVAKDNSFTSFYASGEFPLSVLKEEVLNFQADVMSWPSMSQAVLSDCWATSSQQMDGSPQWDLIINGCVQASNNYSILIPVLEDPSPRFSLIIEGDISKKFYVHCKVLLCDNIEEHDHCNSACTRQKLGMGRRAVSMTEHSEVISAGPIHIMAPNTVSFQHIEVQKKWPAWTWVLSFGLAVIAAFTVGSVTLAVRLILHQ